MKLLLQKMGLAIDRRYLQKAGAIPIPGSEERLLLVCFHQYHGLQPALLPDQTKINPGDQVGELHLSNIRVLNIGKEFAEQSMEWRLIQLVKMELTLLAQACQNGTIPEAIQGFYGVNVLPAAVKRLGFTLFPIPKGWNRVWLGFWESFLRKVFYSFKTTKKVKLNLTKSPYEIWISRREIIRRYLAEKDK
ncbi:MAG TPA: hypothetical protein VHY08_05660 [Bacillota bacterium]|nr:hypothetical protein [Bacillota bacterium]